MQFERQPNRHRRLILEHDSKSGLHELTVATKALGVQTSLYRRDLEKRRQSAYLGVRLGSLDITKPSESIGGPVTFINSKPVAFSHNDALTLSGALVTFVHSTCDDIDYLVRMDPHRCNLRVIETDAAHHMLSQLVNEFGDILPKEKPPFGFY
ncbi:MAG TPA: hypothetical protein VFN31_03450 [Candidatus Saccharimonadales bacterium]|nr:hypothetical protein [Candidatus Saccharimonadales bacterium]